MQEHIKSFLGVRDIKKVGKPYSNSSLIINTIVTNMDTSRGYMARFFTREGERRWASPASQSLGERTEETSWERKAVVLRL